jgi:hypothetical protein
MSIEIPKSHDGILHSSSPNPSSSWEGQDILLLNAKSDRSIPSTRSTRVIGELSPDKSWSKQKELTVGDLEIFSDLSSRPPENELSRGINHLLDRLWEDTAPDRNTNASSTVGCQSCRRCPGLSFSSLDGACMWCKNWDDVGAKRASGTNEID